jgi:sporulation protein YlmC with PRC-barrel domain
MEADQLKGMAIISVSEGSRLGRVAEGLIDTAALRVGALRVEESGKSFVIPFELLKSIGSDAITVESSQVTQTDGGAFGGLVGVDNFKKLKVVDEGGNFVGTVSGVDIDTATGRLTGLTAHRGGVLGLGGTSTTISVDQVRGIGPDVLTVAVDGATAAP